MSDFETIDVDRTTARDWIRFQADLTVHLTEMGEGDTLVVSVEASEEDLGPYVQFLAEGDELQMEASSNEYLHEPYRLSAADEAALAELGFQPPTRSAQGGGSGEDGSANHTLDRLRRHADQLAVIAVRVLRDVFSVPHPVFLDSEGHLDRTPLVDSTDAEPAMQAVVPRDRDQLVALVDEALAAVLGHEPHHDDDGDVPVRRDGSLIFVRVHPHVPTVELFTSVVSDITDLERAAFEVGVLNRDSQFVRYVLVEDRVLGYVDVPGLPFVPHHLRALLATMFKVIGEVEADLAVRAAGRRWPDPSDDDDDDEPTS